MLGQMGILMRLLVLVLLVLGCVGSAAVKPNPLVRSGVKPNLLIPLYIYPHDWGTTEIKRLLTLPKKYPGVKIAVIANVDFDSTDWQDFNYRIKIQGLVKDLSDAGNIVLGYVSSSYTRRPISGDPKGTVFKSDVKTNIERWLTTFPQIRGIFLDEMCYSKTLYEKLEHPCVPFKESKATLVADKKQPYRDVLAYYRSIYKYVRETRGLEVLIANPGTAADKAFFDGTAADNIITFEGSDGFFDPTNPKTFPFDTPPEMTGILVYNDPTPFSVEKLRAVLGKVSLVYFTDDMLTGKELNPWDTLPRYLEEVIAYLAGANP
jgi:hypothetical protein